MNAKDRMITVWVSDITYIWTFEGRLYLAAILDLFSRGIVGLAMDKTIADTLTLRALRQAIVRRNPSKGLFVTLTGEANTLGMILRQYWRNTSLSAA